MTLAALTLAAARKRLLKLADDVDGARFNVDAEDIATIASIAELDEALAVGQEEAWALAVSANRTLFMQEASVSSSSTGVVDLTTLKPMMPIDALNQVDGQMRLKITPMQLLQAPINVDGVKTLKVVYVARVTFPIAAATAFAWGHANVTLVKQIERLMLNIAAAELLITEGAPNPVLEKRRDELKLSLVSFLEGSGWSVIPFDDLAASTRESGYGFVQTAPDTLQIVGA